MKKQQRRGRPRRGIPRNAAAGTSPSQEETAGDGRGDVAAAVDEARDGSADSVSTERSPGATLAPQDQPAGAAAGDAFAPGMRPLGFSATEASAAVERAARPAPAAAQVAATGRLRSSPGRIARGRSSAA